MGIFSIFSSKEEDSTTVVSSDGSSVTVTGSGVGGQAWDDDGEGILVIHDNHNNAAIVHTDKNGGTTREIRQR